MVNWVRRASAITCAALGAAASLIGIAQAGEIDVIADQAKVFRIDEPAYTVIVGNPSIADAIMHDRTTVVVTGKSFGRTNLIILNQDAEPIVDETLVVRADTENLVSLYKSAERQTYTCNPDCENTVRIGDDKDFFSNTGSQVSDRNSLASSGEVAASSILPE
ncbi:pilus assembly protein [Rhodobacteraceae bacterium RKSG542]|uniref:pilus assembly protein N-terminal domain-containing protein n=1 Tax=Pseudovibrio flavus TaxID=2529854 RepID=UPI0012BCC5F4|nr:pilus assembly protein N-terminal domain-containing protein [Pseudovibrio flavus]MTI17167.1 pilus assembly protein [Pseudovibrio flavus]